MSKRNITRDNLNEARILVVDDEPMIAYALQETLAEAGLKSQVLRADLIKRSRSSIRATAMQRLSTQTSPE